MQTSNPVLTDNAFRQSREPVLNQPMTMQGTVTKTALLLALVMLSALWTWSLFVKTGNPASINGLMLIGAIGGLVLAIATTFKQTWAPITAPLYASFQGLFVGGISAILESAFPGIVIQAATLTFGTLAAMLFLYQTKWIQVTDTFRMIVVTATGGIMVAYLISWILTFFHVQVPIIYGSGIASILFSLFVIGVAALNFVLDFDFIDRAAARGAPKYMEWYGAFALMVTMIWLYIEFLRLLSKLKDR